MNKRIFASLQLIDYKLIAISIFEKLAPVEFYDERSLTDPHNAYFFDGFCFVSAQGKFESRFPFFLKVFYSEDDSANSNS